MTMEWESSTRERGCSGVSPGFDPLYNPRNHLRNEIQDSMHNSHNDISSAFIWEYAIQ